MCCIRNKSEKRLLKHPVSLLKIKEKKLKRRTKKSKKSFKKEKQKKRKKNRNFCSGVRLSCMQGNDMKLSKHLIYSKISI